MDNVTMDNITMKPFPMDEGAVIEVWKNHIRGEVSVRYSEDATPEQVRKCFEEHRTEVMETIERWVRE